MAIGFGIASRNWWRAQLKGGLLPSFALNFANITNDFTFTRSSSATRVNEQGLIETVANDVPRIDYTNGVGEFLLEPASTNLARYSEDFTQGIWNKYSNETSATLDNTETNPYGELGSYKITSISGLGRLGINLGVTPSTDYTFSFYVKNIDASNVRLLLTNVTGTSSIDYTNDINQNGWSRIEFSFTSSSGTTCAIQVVRDLPVGESIYIWGAQAEALPYATSYIPTNADTVTRAGELCVDATPTINSEEGTLYIQASALVNGGENRYISLSDGTSLNRVQLLFSSATNRLSVGGKVGDVNFNTLDYNSFVQTDNHKIAFKYSSDGVKLFVDGVERASNTDNVSFPIGTLTDLDLSLWNSSTAPLYGRTKDLKIYTEALTDEQLTQLTTI